MKWMLHLDVVELYLSGKDSVSNPSGMTQMCVYNVGNHFVVILAPLKYLEKLPAQEAKSNDRVDCIENSVVLRLFFLKDTSNCIENL